MILTLLKPGQSTPVTENLPDGNYIVGRSSLSRIVLAYADVSERHALISVRDGKATVEDLKSANGTYVNGVQIDRRTALSDDSIVQIGGTVLRMTDSQPQRDAVPERKEAVSAPVERRRLRNRRRFRMQRLILRPPCAGRYASRYRMSLSCAWI